MELTKTSLVRFPSTGGRCNRIDVTINRW